MRCLILICILYTVFYAYKNQIYMIKDVYMIWYVHTYYVDFCYDLIRFEYDWLFFILWSSSSWHIPPIHQSQEVVLLGRCYAMDLVVSSASARSDTEAPRVWASNDVIPLYPFETQDKMGIAVPKPTKNTSCESYLCFQDALRVFFWPLKRWDDWINSDSRSFGSCFFWVGRRTVIEHMTNL